MSMAPRTVLAKVRCESRTARRTRTLGKMSSAMPSVLLLISLMAIKKPACRITATVFNVFPSACSKGKTPPRFSTPLTVGAAVAHVAHRTMIILANIFALDPVPAFLHSVLKKRRLCFPC